MSNVFKVTIVTKDVKFVNEAALTTVGGLKSFLSDSISKFENDFPDQSLDNATIEVEPASAANDQSRN